MALVKMIREIPEVAGGKTEALVPEDAVSIAMDNGWRLADKASEKKAESVKEEPKVEKKEEPKTEVAEQKFEAKKESVKGSKK